MNNLKEAQWLKDWSSELLNSSESVHNCKAKLNKHIKALKDDTFGTQNAHKHDMVNSTVIAYKNGLANGLRVVADQIKRDEHELH